MAENETGTADQEERGPGWEPKANLDTAMDELGIPAQAASNLKAVGIDQLVELSDWEVQEVAKIEGVGEATLAALMAAADEAGVVGWTKAELEKPTASNPGTNGPEVRVVIPKSLYDAAVRIGGRLHVPPAVLLAEAFELYDQELTRALKAVTEARRLRVAEKLRTDAERMEIEAERIEKGDL